MSHLERSNIDSWSLIRDLRLLNVVHTGRESLDFGKIATTFKDTCCMYETSIQMSIEEKSN